MKSRRKWQTLSNAQTICGRRRSQSLRVRRRWLMRKIAELEARSYLQEAVLLAVLRHTDFKSTTFPESAPPTLH